LSLLTTKASPVTTRTAARRKTDREPVIWADFMIVLNRFWHGRYFQNENNFSMCISQSVYDICTYVLFTMYL
jgi:hypothetical protein